MVSMTVFLPALSEGLKESTLTRSAPGRGLCGWEEHCVKSVPSTPLASSWCHSSASPWGLLRVCLGEPLGLRPQITQMVTKDV